MENKKNERKEEIEEILNSRAAEKENDKKSTPIANGIAIICITSFILLLFLGTENLENKVIINLALLIFIIIGVSTGLYIYYKKDDANKKYKENVMPDIIEEVFENSFYDAEKFIDEELYYESGLFEKKANANYSGSDYINYEKDEINIVASKLRVTYSGGKSPVTQFLGEYFINIFEKDAKNKEIIIKYEEKIPTENRIIFFIIANIPLISIYVIILIFYPGKFGISELMNLIMGLGMIFYINLILYKRLCGTDDLRRFGERFGKQFSDLFIVEGNYTLADMILTKDLINILIEFKKYDGVKTNISIKNNIAYIAFNVSSDLFNGKIMEDNKEKYIKDYYLMKEIRKVNDFIADKVLKALE